MVAIVRGPLPGTCVSTCTDLHRLAQARTTKILDVSPRHLLLAKWSRGIAPGTSVSGRFLFPHGSRTSVSIDRDYALGISCWPPLHCIDIPSFGPRSAPSPRESVVHNRGSPLSRRRNERDRINGRDRAPGRFQALALRLAQSCTSTHNENC